MPNVEMISVMFQIFIVNINPNFEINDFEKGVKISIIVALTLF